MKKIIFIFPFILFSLVRSQEVYKISYDFIDPYSIQNNTKCELYLLGESSLFFTFSKILDPKTLRFNKDETEVIGDTINYTYEVYKDYENDFIYSKSMVKYQKNEIQVDHFSAVEWQSLEGRKMILNYNCKSALIRFRGREYIAYYTEDINSKDGPWKFQGLPGLILEITEKEGRISYHAKKIEKIKDFEFKTSLDINKSLSWNKIISLAREKYLSKKKVLEEKYNGEVKTDFSNSIEIYDLNSEHSYSAIYDVFVEIEEKGKVDNTLISNFKLETSESESNYSYIEKLQNHQGLTNFGFLSEIGYLYKNLNLMLYIQDKESYGTKYIIKDSIPSIKWKILTNSKDKINEYTVTKAIANYNGFYIQAWYTNQIPIENGPDQYSGLPGLILKLIVQSPIKNDSRETKHYVVKKIEKINTLKIIKPTKGKVVTYDEYKEIENENYKKILQMYEGGIDTD